MINLLKHISKCNLDHNDRILLSNFFKLNIFLESLIPLAHNNGVAGLLFYHLNTQGLKNYLNKPDLDYLENIYVQTTQNSLALMAKASEISQIATTAHIKVMALQGLSIIRLYKHPGLRPMGDIDLMISPSDKDIFFQHLYNAGYLPVPSYPDLLTKNGFLLDIHTHILNLDRIKARKYIFPKDMTPMWKNATAFFDNDYSLLCLNPYDNFIALSAHALKHSYSRMIWLTDLYELINVLCMQEDNAWNILADRARFWKQEKIILYVLILIENIYNFNIPGKIKSELGFYKLGFIEKFVINLILNGFSSNELCFIMWLCNIKGISRKSKFLMENIFPGTNIMEQIFNRNSEHIGIKNYLNRAISIILLVWKNLYGVSKLVMNTGQNFFIYK